MSSHDPTPQLPARPNLEHARKSAKRLLKALRAGDPAACDRFRLQHGDYAGQGDEAILAAKPRLSDAQLVIARESGHASWPRFKAHLEAAELDFDARVTALIEAAIEGRMPQARALLEASPEIGRANLYAAAALGEAEAVADVLARRSSAANEPGGPRDWPALLYLGLSRFLVEDLERAIGMRQAAIQLLEAGADPNVYGVLGDPEYKQTPLYGAAGIAGDAELTRLLLEHGADPNDRSETLGPESLYHASEFADNACLKLLLEAGPEPDKVSYCLGRKLDFEDPEGVALYLDHGADPNFRNPFGDSETRLHKAIKSGRSPEIVAMLLASGADPELKTGSGYSSLALATRLGREALVSLLLEKGADPSKLTVVDRFIGAGARSDAEAMQDILAESPDLISRLNFVDQAVLAEMAFEGDADAVRTLLGAGFDIEARGGFGTAVNMAAWRGHASVVELLIAAGANLETKNDFGGTALGSALHGAIHCHSPEGGMTDQGKTGEVEHGDYRRVVELLLENGADLEHAPERLPERPEIDDLLRRWRER